MESKARTQEMDTNGGHRTRSGEKMGSPRSWRDDEDFLWVEAPIWWGNGEVVARRLLVCSSWLGQERDWRNKAVVAFIYIPGISEMTLMSLQLK